MFSFNSSSFYTLNNDNRLNFFMKIIWIILNFFNYINPFNIFYRPKNIILFKPKSLSLLDLENKKDRVPTRTICDLFLNEFPWKGIENKIGPLNILDIGCGKGEYSNIISNYSKLKINKYIGIDVQEKNEWKEKKSNSVNFYLGSSANLEEYSTKNINFYFSHSAIEHINEDLILFKKIQDISMHGKKMLQLHMFPSPKCLLTYGFHGIRQYSNFNIHRILRLFKKNSKSYLIGLGGSEINKIQFRYMYLPIITNFGKGKNFLDKRYEDLDKYHEELKQSLHNDSLRKNKFENCSFYALATFFNFDYDLQNNLNKKI